MQNKTTNFLKRSFCLLLSCGMLLTSAGCSQNGGTSVVDSAKPVSQNQTQTGVEKAAAVNLMEGIQPSAKSASASTSVKDQEVDTDFQNAVIDFSVRLFQQAFSEETTSNNVMISPLSVLTALSMTLNGTEGNTQKQMLAALFADYAESGSVSIETINENLSTLLAGLPSSEQARFHQANSIWFRGSDKSEASDFQVNQDFLQMNADYYNAELFQAPFNEQTLTDINDWVSKHTEGMISQLLDQIPADAVMYLINALAFDAAWESPYQDYQIFDAEFSNADGTSSTVSIMNSEENLYLQTEHGTGFIKPYAENYSFAALLPDENTSIEDFVKELSGEQLQNILSHASEETVTVQIPQFTSEYDTDLVEALKKMYLTLPFDPANADLSGITVTKEQAENLFISRIIHKTYISVNEKGTQAAAATAVELSKASEPDRKAVLLNRPFLYLIIDQSTNLPIFMGVVTQLPEKQ